MRGRREEVGRADLAEVGEGGARALRAVGRQSAGDRLGEREHVVAHPRHRQIGEHLVRLAEPLPLDRVPGRGDQVRVGQHRALGLAGGAGGVADHRHVAAAPLAPPPARSSPGGRRRTWRRARAARPGSRGRGRRSGACPAGRRRRCAEGADTPRGRAGACRPAPGPRRRRCAPRRGPRCTASRARSSPGRAEPGRRRGPGWRAWPSRAAGGCRRRSPSCRRARARGTPARARSGGTRRDTPSRCRAARCRRPSPGWPRAAGIRPAFLATSFGKVSAEGSRPEAGPPAPAGSRVNAVVTTLSRGTRRRPGGSSSGNGRCDRAW